MTETIQGFQEVLRRASAEQVTQHYRAVTVNAGVEN